MIEIKANTLKQIPLGRMGENLARKIVFDISAWITTYGDGHVVLIHQRPQDAIPFPIAIEQHETEVWWPVTRTDTASSIGIGQCELQYYVGDTLVKSKSFETFVEDAMDEPSEEEPPAPEQGWVAQIVAIGVEAKTSADAANADAKIVKVLEEEVAQNASQVAQNTSDAAKAMDAAQTAQRLAEEAQLAAETAQKAAEDVQSAVAKFATDADAAKQAAEAALKATQDAAAAAAKALADIRALYQEMQTWAQGVIQDVNDAGSVAVRSVQTAGDTQVQRVTDEGTTQTANAKAQADDAKLYADEAKQSATDAHTAKTAAETAMDAAVTAQSKADAAQKGAEDAKSEAEASEEASASNAATAMLSAQNAKDSEDAAKASEDNAAQSATDAQAAMTAAQAAQSGAEAAQSAAAQSAQEAAGSASTASTSETNAKASEESAKASETAAQASQTAAAGSASSAANSATSASAAASAASESASAAAASETAAKASEEAAKASETAAKASETAAAESASAAQQSATSAAESAAVYDDVVEDVNQLKEDVAAITPDDTTVDGKPWTSKKIVDSLCQPFEESGNHVQCYPVENYPLGVKVSWEPVQEGSGDPSPDNIRPITGRDAVSVTRCGKNLLDLGDAYVNNYNITGIPNFLTPNTTYSFTVSKSNGIQFAVYIMNNVLANKADKQFRLTTGYVKEGATQTFTTPADMKEYPYFVLAGSTTGIGDIYPDVEFQLELGSTATPYEPYTGDAYDIALPETVYGGEVDAASGEGQETWKTLTLDGTEEWKRLNNYYEVYFRNLGIPSSKNDMNAAKLSQHADRYIIDNPYVNTLTDKCAWVYSTMLYPYANLRIRHEAEQSTLENWKAYLAAQYAAGTPVQVCYKLAEPVPFTATGTQPIPALSGANTVYTDADSVVVTGAEDPKHTITELKNAIISLGGNV